MCQKLAVVCHARPCRACQHEHVALSQVFPLGDAHVLQYAKSMKLHKAQRLLKEGEKANQAAYLVGYNSTAQFSREYKRHFGFTPSETFHTTMHA